MANRPTLRSAPERRLSRALALVSVSFVAGACEHDRSATTASTCGPDDTSSPCLLAAGRTALDEVASDVDWVAAAAEYAEALTATGEKDEAAEILRLAENRVEGIEDTKARATAFVEVGTALVHSGSKSEALRVAGLGEALLASLDAEDTRANLHGKLLSLLAGAGDVEGALGIALELAQDSPAQASFKARTLREIAVHQAEAGAFEQAGETLGSITMGLAYYRSTVRTDVASLALKAGRDELAETLLQEAETIALAQDNGYFLAGAVRDIGAVYALHGDDVRSTAMFEAAMDGARAAASAQEKARALSRIATKLADCQEYESAVEILPEAIELARAEETEAMRHYSLYEIVGAAAFSGAFDAALSLLDEVPATSFGSAASLRSAAQRDVAWGLSRHGRLEDALALANRIETPRERVQALSRMVRLQEHPGMKALPRYL